MILKSKYNLSIFFPFHNFLFLTLLLMDIFGYLERRTSKKDSSELGENQVQVLHNAFKTFGSSSGKIKKKIELELNEWDVIQAIFIKTETAI